MTEEPDIRVDPGAVVPLSSNRSYLLGVGDELLRVLVQVAGRLPSPGPELLPYEHHPFDVPSGGSITILHNGVWPGTVGGEPVILDVDVGLPAPGPEVVRGAGGSAKGNGDDGGGASGEGNGSTGGGSATSFTERIGEVGKWAIGALAAVGSFAVAKFGLAKLGRGPTTGDIDHLNFSDWPGGLAWDLFGALLLTIGAVAIIGSVVWLFTASRVSMVYLRRKMIGKWIADDIHSYQPYLLLGHASVEDFATEYNRILSTDPIDVAKADQYERTRASILETASRERTQRVSGYSVLLVLLGAVLVATGAALFSYNVNSAELMREDQVRVLAQQREDEVKDLAAGELLPRTPTQVLLAIPPNTPRSNEWIRALGKTCVGPTKTTAGQSQPRAVDATLIDVGTPPKPADTDDPVSGGKSAVFQIATNESKKCPVVSGWVPPEWTSLPRLPAPGAE